MLSFYQGRCDANPDSGFCTWLQLRVGTIAYKTWRPEIGVEAYKKFLERFPEYERRYFALLRLGLCLEDASRYDQAIDVYEQFLAEYPTHQDARKAKNGIHRIKHLYPDKKLNP